MEDKKIRIGVVGAGPSGVTTLLHLNRLIQDKDVEVKCFEKASDWGGMWNFDWRTGTDKYGEPMHCSMYRHMWANNPKETVEFPDYTFDHHFGKAIPSYPPRLVLFDYLKGRWKSEGNLKKWIRFNTVVRHVKYDNESKTFAVQTEDLVNHQPQPEEIFDYVIVASGHLSTPNLPDFPGMDQFPGRVCHSHDFKDAKEFAGQRILVIGSWLSGEDISIQCIKFGATSVICSYRSQPMGFDWPSSISDRPILQNVEGKKCFFKDGSSAEVDAIIFCTGYLHYYPYLEENLRLKSKNVLYPRNLYKGVVWMGPEGNGKQNADHRLLYIGSPDVIYSFTILDIQAFWAVNYILGGLQQPDTQKMVQDCKLWLEKFEALPTILDKVHFQGAYLKDLSEDSGYPYDINVDDIFLALMKDKLSPNQGILTFRDKGFRSKYTGTQAPSPKLTFMEAFDDSFETFVNQ